MNQNEPTIYQQNINVLMKVIYSFQNYLSPLLIDEMFQVLKRSHNLRHIQKLANTKTTQQAVSYRALQLWILVPTEIERCFVSINIQRKSKITAMRQLPCKTYIASAGFV